MKEVLVLFAVFPLLLVSCGTTETATLINTSMRSSFVDGKVLSSRVQKFCKGTNADQDCFLETCSGPEFKSCSTKEIAGGTDEEIQFIEPFYKKIELEELAKLEPLCRSGDLKACIDLLNKYKGFDPRREGILSLVCKRTEIVCRLRTEATNKGKNTDKKIEDALELLYRNKSLRTSSDKSGSKEETAIEEILRKKN